MAFLSGSRTEGPNGAQVPSLCPKRAELLRKKICETGDYEIRLSVSSTRFPGILSTIFGIKSQFQSG